MRILERAKEWARALASGRGCCFCGRHEAGRIGNVLCYFGDVVMCRRCLSQPMGLVALDMLYWVDHPEEVPPCKHCGKVVSLMELNPLHGWYFCNECACDFDVTRYWNRVHRRRMERRWAAHALEVKGRRLWAWTP